MQHALNLTSRHTVRYCVTPLRKRLRTRRGGGRVVQGGDACVALAGGGKRAQDEGDATAQGVPTPLHTTPAPTNGTICPPKSLPLKGHNSTQEIFRFLVNPGEKMN